MFKLMSDESSQKLGIGIHKKRVYSFETPFLAGKAFHDSTDRRFLVHVEPNYTSLSTMADCEKPKSKLAWEFDQARSHGIDLGNYRTLDVADAAITALDRWYREILKRSGANQRFLIEKDNSYVLASDDKASGLRYGDAIIRARNVQAFNMMRDNKDLDYETVVGKIMPIFLHALGLKEYKLQQDLSADGFGEARFILEGIGVFAFFRPLQEGRPAYFERYSHINGDYRCTYEGEAKGGLVKNFIFDWLAAAARERDVVLRDDFEAHLDELAQDIRRTWIEKTSEPTSLVHAAAQIQRPDKVISLAAFRPA